MLDCAHHGVGPHDGRVEVLLPPRLPGPGRPRPGQPGQRFTSPQPQSLPQQLGPRVTRGRPLTSPDDQPAEPVHVDTVRIDVQQIPAAPQHHFTGLPGLIKQPPDPGDVHV